MTVKKKSRAVISFHLASLVSFCPEHTFYLNSEIQLVVGQSLHELHILISGQEDWTDRLNILLINTMSRHELFRHMGLYI